ncbi:MAG: hypothetical protein RIS35_3674 [Pseudomonadota bacterium]|jgi:pyruvate ferredoxin oxidoreductase gamma subunit
MFRIRLHGRGGQGIKTGGQVLGTAFFLEGFQVQDAPRYGAERRGAPIASYVRAGRMPIQERGVIAQPDLVVVADETLIPIPSAGVMQGADAHTVLVVASTTPAPVWRERLNWPGPVLTLAPPPGPAAAGLHCAAAAARLVGVIGRETLEQSIAQEGPAELPAAAIRAALDAFDAQAPNAGCVREAEVTTAEPGMRPDWIDPPTDPASVAAPDILASANSGLVRTGAWRTMRPVIDPDRCRHCSWICGTLCPDGAIRIGAGRAPTIDLDHCKGCLVCVAVCPTHAIDARPEREDAG